MSREWGRAMYRRAYALSMLGTDFGDGEALQQSADGYRAALAVQKEHDEPANVARPRRGGSAMP